MSITAVLLAAGRGSRLGSLTNDVPKPLMRLGGRTLLDRGLESLSIAGIHDVVVVTGYRDEAIKSLDLGGHGQRVRLAHNAEWETSGIVSSLMTAAPERLGGDVVVVYGDIVYEPETITAALTSGSCPPGVTVPVNTQWKPLWSARMEDVYADAESLVLADDGSILEIGQRVKGPEQVQGQFMGIVCLAEATVAPFVHHYRDVQCRDDALHPRHWDMTRVLTSWIESGHRVGSIPISGGWLEVDTDEDLRVYEQLYAEGLLQSLCALRGGARDLIRRPPCRPGLG